MAHECGNIIATCNLANCYEEGKGTNINLQKAFELYKLAHENVNIIATNNLAICYEEGIGTNRNIIKAIELFILCNEINEIKTIDILENEYTDVLNYLKHIKNNEILKILTNKIPSHIIFNFFNNQIQTLHTLKDLGMYNALSNKIIKYAY